MDATLARGYAQQLIRQTTRHQDAGPLAFGEVTRNGFFAFAKCSYAKRPTLVANKLYKSVRGSMKPRITRWDKNHKSVVLDVVRSYPKFAYYDFHDPEKLLFKEDSLALETAYYCRKFDDLEIMLLRSPSIGKHAIARLLERGGAAPETLRAVCYAALSRARDAAALLDCERPYDLLLPFQGGALAVQSTGRYHTDDGNRPRLSVRTYLSASKLSLASEERILDLAAFYAERAYSDTDRYRSLLEQNRRFRRQENVLPHELELEQEQERELEIRPELSDPAELDLPISSQEYFKEEEFIAA